MNTDNEQLLVRTFGDGLICVNGCMVGDAGDGDRLGIEVRTSSKLNFPKNREMRAWRASTGASSSERWVRFLPLRKNGTQKTMLIVQSDLGIEDATQLLEQTTNASDVIDGVREQFFVLSLGQLNARGKLMVSLSKRRTVTW